MDKRPHQIDASLGVQIDHHNAQRAQPVQPALKRPALSHNQRPKPKLSHQPAAIPARSQRRHHDQIPIRPLPPRVAKCIRLAMRRRIAILHPAIVSRAQQLPLSRKNGSANRNSAFVASFARFCKSNGKQFDRVESRIHSVQNNRSARLRNTRRARKHRRTAYRHPPR